MKVQSVAFNWPQEIVDTLKVGSEVSMDGIKGQITRIDGTLVSVTLDESVDIPDGRGSISIGVKAEPAPLTHIKLNHRQVTSQEPTFTPELAPMGNKADTKTRPSAEPADTETK